MFSFFFPVAAGISARLAPAISPKVLGEGISSLLLSASISGFITLRGWSVDSAMVRI